MRVTNVELHPDGSSDVKILSFRDPKRQNPFNIIGIDGLDADMIVPRYYGVSDNEGTSPNVPFYEPRQVKRDVVIRIQLNPIFSQGMSFSDLRDELYKCIASSRTGTIQIQFKNETTYTPDLIPAFTGWVTKFEASLFDANPKVQLTITTIDPVLRTIDPISYSPAGLNPQLFTLTDSSSTKPHGFHIVLESNNIPFSFLTIENNSDPHWSFTVTPSTGITFGDILHISSEVGEMQVYMELSNGNVLYLADKIAPGSVWPMIFPGDNTFRIQNGALVQINSIQWHTSFWGV